MSALRYFLFPVSSLYTVIVSTSEILSILSSIVERRIETIRNWVLISRQLAGTLGVVEEQRFRNNVSIVVLGAVQRNWRGTGCGRTSCGC